MRITTEKIEHRTVKYREYLADLPNASIRRVMIGFAAALLVAEAVVRIHPPQHFRSAVSALGGGAWMYEEALRDPSPKVLALGDSTLIGGGVGDVTQTDMYRLAQTLKTRLRLINLALPGGNMYTTTVMLDALKRHGVTNVDRCIIQTTAGSFLSTDPAPANLENPRFGSGGTMGNMPYYFADADPWSLGMDVDHVAFHTTVDVRLQQQLGRVSALYRARDAVRTEVTGTYPTFWAIAALLPTAEREKVLGMRGAGTNRLGADLEDLPYKSEANLNQQSHYFFAGLTGDRLIECIRLAKSISKNPPILYIHPIHYSLGDTPSSILSDDDYAFKQFDRYIDDIAKREGAEVVRIRSQDFQDPRYWTNTILHPSGAGHIEMFERTKDQFARIFRSDR